MNDALAPAMRAGALARIAEKMAGLSGWRRRGAAFLDSLGRKAPRVRVESRIYEQEGHVPFPFVYDGLLWIYAEKAETNP